MSEPDQNELIKQLGLAWEAAQKQLADLRSQVERTTELAQAKLQSNFLERDKEKALLELGRQVWAMVRDGRLSLPDSLAAPLAVVEEAQRRHDAQGAEITQLLMEPDLPSTGEQAKAKGVAPREKKR